MANGQMFEVEGLGYQAPKATPCSELQAGEVGFLYANIKTVSDAKIGDTITEVENPSTEALPGFEEIKPMVVLALLSPRGISRARALARRAGKIASQR